MKNYILLVKILFKIHKRYYTLSNTSIHLFLFSKISYFVTPFFIYLKIRPNFVTMINFILSVISIFILFFLPNYFIWAILIYVIYKTLDFVDGNISRYNSMSTFYGKFIDGLVDIFYQSFFLLSLSIYYFNLSGDYKLFCLGLFSSLITCFDTFIHDRYSAIVRWMNKDLKKDFKPYIRAQKNFQFKIFLFYSDILFFLIVLLLYNHLIYENLTLNFLFIFLITIISGLHNIIFHLLSSFKNLNYFSKIKSIRN
jgi:phosphatidylglycerophosphate synthase